VDFLKGKLTPAATIDQDQFKKLLADLDSDNFAVRKAARVKLGEVAQGNWPMLQNAVATTESAEVRTAIEAALAKVDKPNASQLDFAFRVLARVYDPQSVGFLKSLCALPEQSELGKQARLAMAQMPQCIRSMPLPAPSTQSAARP
jgi:hypothetical protein